MKQIFLIALALVLALPSAGQELSAKEQRKLEKQLRKEQEAEEAARKAEVIKAMVEYQRFILEANNIRLGHQMEKVSADLNYIAIDSLNSSFQIGSGEWIGDNGVGGLTVSGKIEKYEHSYNEKKGVHTLKWFIRSTVDRYNITMYISDNGRSEAQLRTSFGREIFYIGEVVPIPASTVYEGFARY